MILKIVFVLFLQTTLVSASAAEIQGSVFFSDKVLKERTDSGAFINRTSLLRVEPFLVEKMSRSKITLIFLENNKTLKLKKVKSNKDESNFLGTSKLKSSDGRILGESVYELSLGQNYKSASLTKSFTETNSTNTSSLTMDYKQGNLIPCIILNGINFCRGGYAAGPNTKNALIPSGLKEVAFIKNIITGKDSQSTVLIVETHYSKTLSSEFLLDATSTSTQSQCLNKHCIGQNFRQNYPNGRSIEGIIEGIMSDGSLVLNQLRWNHPRLVYGVFDKKYALEVKKDF